MKKTDYSVDKLFRDRPVWLWSGDRLENYQTVTFSKANTANHYLEQATWKKCLDQTNSCFHKHTRTCIYNKEGLSITWRIPEKEQVCQKYQTGQVLGS